MKRLVSAFEKQKNIERRYTGTTINGMINCLWGGGAKAKVEAKVAGKVFVIRSIKPNPILLQ